MIELIEPKKLAVCLIAFALAVAPWFFIICLLIIRPKITPFLNSASSVVLFLISPLSLVGGMMAYLYLGKEEKYNRLKKFCLIIVAMAAGACTLAILQGMIILHAHMQGAK